MATASPEYAISFSNVALSSCRTTPHSPPRFSKNWKINCYGRYVPHKEEFEKYYQPDLAALYAQGPPPTPLGFAFGYHWQKEDGILMVATARLYPLFRPKATIARTSHRK